MSEIIQIPIENILPHPENPRGPLKPDDPTVIGLADEIKAAGVLYQPLNVVPMPECEGYFRNVIGHRRHAALKLLGWPTASCVVRDWNAREQRATMMAENLQREDLTALQEARGYEQLRQELGQYTDVARRLGITTAQIQSRVSILRLAPKVQALFDSDEMPTSVVYDLLKVTDPQRQERLALLVFNRQCTTKELAHRVARLVEDQQLDNSVEKERKATKPRATRPTKVRDYCRTEAEADLTRLNGTALTYTDVRKAMEGVCVDCGMGKYREICGACALPQLVERLVANAQGQA